MTSVISPLLITFTLFACRVAVLSKKTPHRNRAWGYIPKDIPRLCLSTGGRGVAGVGGGCIGEAEGHIAPARAPLPASWARLTLQSLAACLAHSSTSTNTPRIERLQGTTVLW